MPDPNERSEGSDVEKTQALPNPSCKRESFRPELVLRMWVDRIDLEIGAQPCSIQLKCRVDSRVRICNDGPDLHELGLVVFLLAANAIPSGYPSYLVSTVADRLDTHMQIGFGSEPASTLEKTGYR